jgi:hypothetical protein
MQSAVPVTKGAEIPRYKRPKTMSDANVTDEQFTGTMSLIVPCFGKSSSSTPTTTSRTSSMKLPVVFLPMILTDGGRLRIKPNDAVRTYKAITIKNFIVSPHFSSVSPIYPGS